LRSEGLENTIWAKSSTIVTAPVVTENQTNSPSGVSSADRIVFPAVSGAGAYSLVNQFFSQSAGVAYNASIYLRGLVGGEKVWWAWTPNGVTYVRKECVLTTSWQRFDFTYTSIAGNNFIQLGVDLRDASQSAQSAQTIFAWGAQLEAGSFPTSYIPTTTAAVVRSADVCSITGSAFSRFYNQSEGTIVASGLTNRPNNDAGAEIFRSNDGTSNNRIQIGMTNIATQAVRPFITASGTTTYSSTNGTASVGVERKIGTAYKTDDAISAFNGTLGTLDTTVTLPTNTNQAILFSGLGSGTISSLRYFKKRLSNAKLQSLTT
jgi:hypothetical protein